MASDGLATGLGGSNVPIRAIFKGAFSCSGAGAASGDSTIPPSIGSADGLGDAQAAGAFIGFEGHASGIGGSSVPIRAIAKGTFSCIGVGAADAVSFWLAQASGAGDAQAQSQVTAKSQGSASGLGAATSSALGSGIGIASAAGLGAAAGSTQTISGNVGLATGRGFAFGITTLRRRVTPNSGGPTSFEQRPATEFPQRSHAA